MHNFIPTILSSFFLIVSLLISNTLTIILLKYQSSILYINRTILINLNTALIIIMNISVNEQSGNLLLRLCFGPLPTQYAFVARVVILICMFLFHWVILTLNIFRIILIQKVCIASQSIASFFLNLFCPQPSMFYNLNHEKVFKLVFTFLLLLAISLLIVDNFYHTYYLSGKVQVENQLFVLFKLFFLLRKSLLKI